MTPYRLRLKCCLVDAGRILLSNMVEQVFLTIGGLVHE